MTPGPSSAGKGVWWSCHMITSLCILVSMSFQYPRAVVRMYCIYMACLSYPCVCACYMYVHITCIFTYTCSCSILSYVQFCVAEENRIYKAGGWVEFNRVNGNLALSRAIGDFNFKSNQRLKPEEQIITGISLSLSLLFTPLVASPTHTTLLHSTLYSS